MPAATQDPTYVTAEIEANPVWRVAFWLSEWNNDDAPLGWANYIPVARTIVDNFDKLKERAGK